MNGTTILNAAPMMGAILAERRSFAADDALHHQEIGGPVADRNHRAQAEDDAGPVDAHGVVLEVSRGCSTGGCNPAPGKLCVDARHHAAPSAGFDQAEDGDQQRAQPDQDELQHLIEDGGEQAAEEDINGDGDRRDPDAEVDVPAEHDLHTSAMEYMLMPLISTVMKPKEMAERARAGSPKRSFR